jgi:DNA-binding MltR family transcriptional regulator
MRCHAYLATALILPTCGAALSRRMTAWSLNIKKILESTFVSSQTPAIPDATFALIVATAVEQSLELAISTHFVVDEEATQRMFSESASGPLNTFSAKIKIGHALGIYPKVARDELDMVRHIRNTFAHSWERVNFQTPAIVDACMSLQLAKRDDDQLERNDATPKARFLLSARDLYLYLEWNSDTAKVDPMRYASHPGRAIFEKIEASTKP